MRTASLLATLLAVLPPTAALAQPVEPPPVVSPGPGTAPAPPIVSPGAAPAPVADAGIDQALSLRLRILEQNLLTLDARSSTGRVVNGIASLVLGGVFVTLGAALSDETLTGEPPDPDAADDIRGIFFVFGGLSVADGLLTLVFIPSLGDAALDFQAMPYSPRRAALRKMAFGQRALRQYAEDSRTDRLVNGIGGTLLGLAGLGAMVVLFDITPDRNPVFFYILVAFGAIEVIGGVIEIVTPSRAERMWDAYQRAARANPIRRQQASLRPGMVPLFAPDGSLAGATATLGLGF